MLDIYVINLKEREDRWNNIIKTFGTNFNLIRVDAVKHENGLIGCFMSHQKCLNIAKEKRLKNIIVIEDDCIINPLYKDNFINKINEIEHFLNNYNEWDIFLGACNRTLGTNIIKKIINNKNIYIQINMATTAHFIIYNQTSYDFFLNIHTINEAIDRIWHYKLKALTLLPFIFYQLNNYSDIEKTETNYIRKIQITEKRLLNYIDNNKI